eukprot:g60211.t1
MPPNAREVSPEKDRPRRTTDKGKFQRYIAIQCHRKAVMRFCETNCGPASGWDYSLCDYGLTTSATNICFITWFHASTNIMHLAKICLSQQVCDEQICKMEVEPQKNRLSKSWKVSKTHQRSYTGGKIELSSDGNFLACWCAEDVSILDIATSDVKRMIESDEDDGFSCFALSPDGKTLMTASSRSCMLRLWDLSDGKELLHFRGHNLPMLDLAFEGSGTYLATASADKTVRVWHTHKKFVTHSFKGHNSIVQKVQFHPDPCRLELFSCSEDGEVRVWNLHSGQCKVLANHMSLVTGLAFSPDGWTLVTGGRDRIISIWDLQSFTCKNTLPVYETLETLAIVKGPISGISNSEGKLLIMAGGERGVIRFFDLATRLTLYTMPIEAGAKAGPSEEKIATAEDDDKRPSNLAKGVRCIILSPKAESMITVTEQHNLHVYALPSLERKKLIIGHNDEVLAIRTLPDNRRAVVATNSQHVRLFDLKTFDAQLLSGHSSVVVALDITRDGRWLVTAGQDRIIRFWSLPEDGVFKEVHCVAEGKGHTEAIGAVAFSRCPSREHPLFAVSGSQDRTVKVWQCAGFGQSQTLGKKKGQKLQAEEGGPSVSVYATYVAHQKDINALAVAPNDKLIAS